MPQELDAIVPPDDGPERRGVEEVEHAESESRRGHPVAVHVRTATKSVAKRS